MYQPVIANTDGCFTVCAETSAVYMPELLHNIERLVLKTEEAILRNDRTYVRQRE